MNSPKVSFVIATYFGEKTLNECLKAIFSQNYPKNKIEVLIVDGGSIDKTLEIAKKYPVIIMHNPLQWNDGVGMGKHQGSKKSTGDFIAFVDQDNIILGKNWIREMLKPFFKDDRVSIVGAKLAVVKSDVFVNKYLSLVGTDPFAAYLSLEGQLELNENEFEKDGDFLVYDLAKKKPLCAGSNGYMYKRKYFDMIDGYTRDNANIARLAKLKTKMVVSLKARLHHKTVTSFFGLLKKRNFWTRKYFNEKPEKNEFKWLPEGKDGKAYFLKNVIQNLAILPNIYVAMKKFNKSGEPAWMLHPILLFIITLIYIVNALTTFGGLKLLFSWFFNK